MFDIAFTVISNTEDGSDVTPAMLKAALEQRIQDLTANGFEWHEACGLCDTYEMEE
jgi:hypothetical protein